MPMKIDAQMSDDLTLSLIGERLAEIRLRKNMSQRQLAEQAGLSVPTIQRLETGVAATQLSGFIRVCRVLGLIERLDLLLPEQTPSPIAMLKLQGRRRKRASTSKSAPTESQKWTWGGSS